MMHGWVFLAACATAVADPSAIGENAAGDLVVTSQAGRTITVNDVDLMAALATTEVNDERIQSRLRAQDATVAELERRQLADTNTVASLLGAISTLTARVDTLITAQTTQAVAQAELVRMINTTNTAQAEQTVRHAEEIGSLVRMLNTTNIVLNATNRRLAGIATAGGDGSSGRGNTNADGEEYNQGFGSTVLGDIKFYQQDSFEILSKMREVSDVYAINITGYVTFDRCGGMTNVALQAFSRATTIGGRLYFYDNAHITSINELGTLESVGDLRIYSEDSLADLSGFDNLTEITNGGLTILEPTAIRNMSLYFPNLEVITGTIGLNMDARGTQYIGGFAKLRNVSRIHYGGGGRSALRVITGHDNMTWIPGDVYIGQHQQLQELSGFENVAYIGGSLTFNSLYQIDVITAFPNLVEIGGRLLVEDCRSLHTLQLPSLQKVGGDITVYHTRQQSLRTYGFANTLQCYGGINPGACINCPSRWYGLSGCG